MIYLTMLILIFQSSALFASASPKKATEIKTPLLYKLYAKASYAYTQDKKTLEIVFYQGKLARKRVQKSIIDGIPNPKPVALTTMSEDEDNAIYWHPTTLTVELLAAFTEIESKITPFKSHLPKIQFFNILNDDKRTIIEKK